ncbi:DUF4395 family protein [Spirosoma sp. HMF4905]|uniref:DUF4395 family protein n=1 Tax=Spirosoma arboris TaxID=2682092 RepID=A0A7K1SC81_9BACT|nr:DUF4395 domain-containing protein [Spirosoma arboris]MVM31409.1 DUF4395 family protein [Spirosoma arboris]
MNTNLECPVDGIQINETKVRMVAGLVLITGLVYLVSGWLVLPLLLVLDFGLRSFDFGKYSLFGNVAEWLVKILRLPYKATDQAPKRFAARIGFAFGVLISTLQLAGVSTIIPTGVLVIFAALESIAGFCAGCYVYTFYIRLFPKAA